MVFYYTLEFEFLYLNKYQILGFQDFYVKWQLIRDTK